MSEIFEINGRLFAFGQRWYHLSGEESEKRETANRAKDAGKAKHVTTIKKNGGTVCGFFVNKAVPKKPLYSAAAVFASACNADNALLTYAITDSVVSIIGIKDGLPDPEADYLGTMQDVAGMAQKFIQENGDRAFTVFDNAGIFNDAEPFDFVSAEFDPLDKTIQVLPLGRSHALFFGVILLAAFIPAGYYGFYVDYAAQKKREEAARNQVDPVVVYLESMRAALKTELNMPANATARIYQDVIDGVELYKGGWVLQSIECAQALCTTTWLSKPWGTHITFADQSHDAKALQLTLIGDQIREPIPVEIQTDQSTAAEPEKELPVLFDFLMNGVSLLQEYRLAGLTFELRDVMPFGVQAGGAVPENVPGGIVRRGEWKIAGPMGLFSDALRGLPLNMSLAALAVQPNEQNIESSMFTAEGYYYVRR